MKINPLKLAELKRINLDAAQYTPLEIQKPIIEYSKSPILVSGGEGSGKSHLTAALIAARYGLWQLVHLVTPKYDSAHKEADYLYAMLKQFGAVATYSKPRTGKLLLKTRDGAQVESISTESEGARAVTGTGDSPDIIAMVEAGKQSYDVFLACLTRITRSHGLLILSGTIEEGERWYPELITRWQADNPEGGKTFIVPTWANTKLYPGGRDDPAIKMLEGTLTPEKFAERLAAVPCVASDLVIKEFSFLNHVRADVEYDPRRPTELWIDPGYSGSHYAVLVVQFPTPRDVWVVDEIYTDHATTQEVIAEAKNRDWWGYTLTGVGDIATKQHAAMPSVWEVWNDAGVPLRTNRVAIAEGIELHRTFLKPPDGSPARLLFNPKCRGVFSEYGAWKRKRITDLVYGEPSDKHCDALKAINYGLFDRFGALGEKKESPIDPGKDAFAFAG